MALAPALPGSAAAAPQLVPVGQFAAPVAVAAPPADPARLFVVERGGLVRLVKNGAVVAAPFADLRAQLVAGGERGLLGLAFAPDYASSGLAYVFLTAADPPGQLQVRELRRSATDPDRAVAGPGRLVLAVPHPDAGNHNGGQLAFGPDGLLYVATGDGGDANDPENDAADTASLLGKILRIDPRGSSVVPAGNPFGNAVWSYGLRNPWRFSFDRGTGDLVIGDVGQGVREEVDWAPAAAGGGRAADFGWHCWEGTIPTPSDPQDPSSAPLCIPADRPDSQAPVLERDHDGDGFCAIVGGFVVRDPGLPSLAGRYLYGDNCHSGIESVVLGAAASPAPAGVAVSGLTSFGEDACGRIYTAALGGVVSRLQDGPATACGPLGPAAPGAPPPGGTPQTPAPDSRAPLLRVRYRGVQRLRRLRVSLRSDEGCRVTLRARRLRPRHAALSAGATRTLRLRPTRNGGRRIRRALAQDRRVRLTIRITAVDAAGNTRLRRARVHLSGA